MNQITFEQVKEHKGGHIYAAKKILDDDFVASAAVKVYDDFDEEEIRQKLIKEIRKLEVEYAGNDNSRGV